LYVKQGFRDSTVKNLCISDVYYWTAGNEVREYVASDLGVGDFQDVIPGTGANGCDSSYYLNLHIDTVFLDTIHVVLCASDEHFEWHGTVYDSYLADSRNWTDSLALYQRYDTVTMISNCDSTWVLHLTIGPSKGSVTKDTICEGEKLRFYDQELKEPGTYTHTDANKWGCIVEDTLILEIVPPTTFEVQTDPVCVKNNGVGETYTLRYSYKGEFAPVSYSVYYDLEAQAAGFVDQEDISIPIPPEDHVEGEKYDLEIPAPVFAARENYPRPGSYHATVGFNNGVCLSDSLMIDSIDITFSYPAWMLEQRHGDVIAILDSAYNGGYTWTSYQWYEGDSLLVGQTKPYLYIPTGLTVGAEYRVVLTREGETDTISSCGIVAGENPVSNDYGPTLGYLAVTPTCVTTANPRVYILSRKDGTFRITSAEGRLVSEGIFRADVTPVDDLQQAQEGLYIIQLWSDDTPEEPYRAIKVLVSPSCPNCDISSF
jgi:hypothetical protein